MIQKMTRSSTPISLAVWLTAFQTRPTSVKHISLGLGVSLQFKGNSWFDIPSWVSPVWSISDLLASKICSKVFHVDMGGKEEAGPE